MRLSNANQVIVPRVELASTAWRRMKGLLGRESLPEGEGLLLRPCNSIHTFGMRFAIDVVFLDRELGVVAVSRNLRPGRMAWGGACARQALEVGAGWLELPQLGDRLRLD